LFEQCCVVFLKQFVPFFSERLFVCCFLSQLVFNLIKSHKKIKNKNKKSFVLKPKKLSSPKNCPVCVSHPGKKLDLCFFFFFVVCVCDNLNVQRRTLFFSLPLKPMLDLDYFTIRVVCYIEHKRTHLLFFNICLYKTARANFFLWYMNMQRRTLFFFLAGYTLKSLCIHAKFISLHRSLTTFLCLAF
jgi:hypothetical protein